MEAFINGLSVISPQNTFAGESLLSDMREYTGVRSLNCMEPRYSDYIDPMAARRMSRIIKMGVSTALKCLKDSGIESPDAIITGTGLGCIEDTGRFLVTLYENEEKLLNPTPFIQSTHNTVGASIALMLKCRNYNNTYGHRSFSFESALLDGMMLLGEGEAKNILVGGLDELTPDLFTITDRLGLWKKEPVKSLHLREFISNGSLAGEGSAFFSLSAKKREKSFARIVHVDTLFKPAGNPETEKWLSETITGFREPGARPDLVILGINGDRAGDDVYSFLMNKVFTGIHAAYYKHLCGEYSTSSSFALAIAASVIREQRIPEIMLIEGKPGRQIKNILIYNHFRNINHSAILVSSC